jgi:hypothetical protein
MQIVINIPEEEYKYIKEIYEHSHTVEATYSYIYHGTPLPEHHGRLIDADELKKHKYHDSDRFENAVAVAQIDLAPTIIEESESE